MNTIPNRIFAKDSKLWSDSLDVQEKVENRLGWLDSIEFCLAHLDEISSFVEQVKLEGFQQVVLLGMGGSALAPEVFSRLFPQQQDGLELTVLDTTCAEQIIYCEQSLDLSKTLFIASSKSGTTVETWSLFQHFYQRVEVIKGLEAGRNFAVITDAGSDLQTLAKQKNLRYCFINPSDIGGRFSALSYFGLVPAALLGISLDKLLARAQQAQQSCQQGDGDGLKLGEWLVAGYTEQSFDKLLLNVSDQLEPLVWWIEQLVAESLGKQEYGLLPVLNKEGEHKNFVQTKTLTLNIGQATTDFSQKNQAVWSLQDTYDVAAHFFHWEFATAMAGAYLGINPFDEPNVTEAKLKTNSLLERYSNTPLPLPAEKPLSSLWAQAQDDSYVAILAYWPINETNYNALHEFRKTIETELNVPVTVNFGPRYLHSTGQLHKGGKRQGLFIVLAQSEEIKLSIPNQNYTFNTLCRAQALGDFQILTEKGFPANFYTLPCLSALRF